MTGTVRRQYVEVEDARAYLLASLEYGTHPMLRLQPHIGNVDRCRQGHDRTPDNTHVRADGVRVCRICWGRELP